MAVDKNKQRLLYIDGMRGLACIFMFQTHCYDAWLSPSARASKFFRWSQLASTPAATSFLFLVGVSLSLAIDGMYRRGADSRAVVASTLKRGAKILALAFLFRSQELLHGFRSVKLAGLLRVDVLNVIGVSIALLSLLAWVRDRRVRGFAAALTALGIAMLTPLVWTAWRPTWLPWYLESYLDGVHTFGKPQSWLFPIFPWSAFCFAGLAVGVLLRSEWAKRREGLTMTLVAIGGGVLAALALFLDALPVRLYPVYDFWRTSPNFFLIRVSLLLALLAGCYLWARWGGRPGAGEWLFARLVDLGQSSLTVYWVHIWFVYGSLSILPKRAASILQASFGLLVIAAAMTLLAAYRGWLLSQGRRIADWFKQKPQSAIPDSGSI
jgi:uncharacterized membrane protein